MATKIYEKHAAVAETITIDDIDPEYNHAFAAFKYFSDASLETEVTPTGGTLEVQGKPLGAGGYGLFDSSTIDCTDLSSFASSNAPSESVRVVPASVTGAAYYQLTLTGRGE